MRSGRKWIAGNWSLLSRGSWFRCISQAGTTTLRSSSGPLGGDVWIGDDVEAQYLQTTTDHLAQVGNGMAGEGLIKLERRWAMALPALMARAEEFEGAMRSGLAELEKK